MYTKNQIIELLHEHINRAKTPVIIGGHFALANDPTNTRLLIPAIFQDCQDPSTRIWMEKHHYMSHFPSETFSMSVDMLQVHSHARLMLLVNDWQHVKDTDVLKSKLRNDYYINNRIPPLFEKLASNKKIDITSRIIRGPREFNQEKSIYWSEINLRNKFSSAPKYKSCSLKNGCAQEVTPLFDSCEKMGVDTLVAFVPGTCAYPIIDATNEFKNMRYGSMNVLMIACTNPLSLENFWDAPVFLNGKELN